MADNSDIQHNNKRIAKNTIVLYIRMLFTMLVGLYTSRVVLYALGVNDYGVYNAIGGMVAMLSILSGSMSVAISRYITVWIGKNDRNQLKRVFSTSIIIQLIMSLLVILIAEFVGVWFLENKMVIPSGRLFAAHWVLQLSIFTFLVGLLSVPYNAVIIAHERMSAFAYISVLEVLLKLAVAFIISTATFDRLILYSLLLAVISVLLRLVYGIYCHRHFEESHFKLVIDFSLLKEMFSFIGLAFWGNAVWHLNNNGINLMMNVFYGPVVNAARGVAMQVNTAVYSFVSNFLVAVNPQITKSCSTGDFIYMNNLITRTTKFAFMIMLLITIPVLSNVHFLLSLWLVEIPSHAENFVVLVLISTLVQCFSQPMLTGVLAEGHIKSYELVLTFLYLANFVLCYIMLSAELAPEWCFVSTIVFDILIVLKLLLQLKQKTKFDLQLFFLNSLVPSLSVLLICCFFTFFVMRIKADSLFSLLYTSVLLLLFTGTIIWVVGLKKDERNYAKNGMEKFISKIK